MMHFKAFGLLFLFTVSAKVIFAQDSVLRHTDLEPVRIVSYFNAGALLSLPVSMATIGENSLKRHQGLNFVSVSNSIPGVRMEERSPGSYRMSIRGSLLRSPFGVRNIKVYLEDFPLTDAGGNTYLNLLDPWGVSGMELLKGPDGSVFGANSGGVVLLNPFAAQSGQPSAGELEVQTGSYGLFNQQLRTAFYPKESRYGFSFNQSFQRANGYRDHSHLNKKVFQTRHVLAYPWSNADPTRENDIKILALYSDLDYRTPGGLTQAQFLENPQAARPPSGPTPGAEMQNAGIRNRTFLGGLTHTWNLNRYLSHKFSVFGSSTDFSNPFITNFEERMEKNYGIRTYLAYSRRFMRTNYRLQAGTEWQQGRYDISNFDNHLGKKGEIQAQDQLDLSYHYYFLHAQLNFGEKWHIHTGLSLNFQHFDAHRFEPVWMPKFALSYAITPRLNWRATLSKGFSPPSAAEIRPSDNQINRTLRPEQGWNYESGLRWFSSALGIQLDASLFHYSMRDAIVRNLRESGAEYFTNAGGVRQNGLEMSLVKSSSQGWHWTSSWAWSHFKFADYHVQGRDFSGNFLTGVPRHQLFNGVQYSPLDSWAFFLSHQYTSEIPLTDANSVFADDYHLVQSKITFERPLRRKTFSWRIFGGIDNMLNQNYSLGNDINAFGDRFYNPAPGRNYYLGMGIGFN